MAGNWAPSYHEANKEDGHRGDLSLPEYLEASAKSQNLSYLLRKLAASSPNQVWAMDLTCIIEAEIRLEKCPELYRQTEPPIWARS